MRGARSVRLTRPLTQTERGSQAIYVFRFISDGEIIWRANYEYREDLDALDEAEQLADCCEVQIWQEGRMIARVQKGSAPLGMDTKRVD